MSNGAFHECHDQLIEGGLVLQVRYEWSRRLLSRFFAANLGAYVL